MLSKVISLAEIDKISNTNTNTAANAPLSGYPAKYINVHHAISNLVSWKSRVIGFGHAEQDIGDADRAEYR